MKKIISVLLAVVIFFSIANIAFAEKAAPQYKLTNVSYDGKDVTGKVELTSGEAFDGKIKVKVTFFIIGNYYMATSYTVGADGSFKITGVGPIVYITVSANGINDEGTTKLAVAEIIVEE